MSETPNPIDEAQTRNPWNRRMELLTSAGVLVSGLLAAYVMHRVQQASTINEQLNAQAGIAEARFEQWKLYETAVGKSREEQAAVTAQYTQCGMAVTALEIADAEEQSVYNVGGNEAVCDLIGAGYFTNAASYADAAAGRCNDTELTTQWEGARCGEDDKESIDPDLKTLGVGTLSGQRQTIFQRRADIKKRLQDLDKQCVITLSEIKL